jgi:anti-sigma B factor antagonist
MELGHLSVESSIAGDGRTGRLSLGGELDLNGVDAVSAALDEIAARDVTAIEVDASELTFLDSSGLRALLTGREQLQAKGIHLRVVNPSASIRRLLDMTATRSILEG